MCDVVRKTIGKYGALIDGGEVQLNVTLLYAKYPDFIFYFSFWCLVPSRRAGGHSGLCHVSLCIVLSYAPGFSFGHHTRARSP